MELLTLARRARGAMVVAIALALAACGGGGGGGSPPPTSNPPPPPPPPPPPTVSVTVTPATVEEGDSVQVTWSSSGAVRCEAAGDAAFRGIGWASGPIALSGTVTAGPLRATTDFFVSCATAADVPGSAGQGVIVVPSPPVLTLQATPRIVRDGQATQLTWTGSRVTACEAASNWSGPRPTSGAETVGPFPLEITYDFRMSCKDLFGDPVDAVVFVESRKGANAPPVADAGPDRSEGSAHRVDLSTFGSSDDHGIVSSMWSQIAGPNVTLQFGNTQLDRSFTAPIVDTDTVLTFALTVIDDEGLASAPDTVDITILPLPPIVTITGNVSYQEVPHGPAGTGLAYGSQDFVTLPDVLVEVLDASSHTVLASGSFPTNFVFDVPSATDLQLRATALTSRQAPQPLPHWQISVRDLDSAGTPIGDVYSYTGPVFNSGPGGTQDLQIPSGWSFGGQLIGPRAAAPFAILGALRPALDHARSTSIAPQPDLPELLIDWSPNNSGGETFFQAVPGGTSYIVLAGEADVDTDEYDPSVIRHEFGHFIMYSVSRDDSIGGAHAITDAVDMRVAASEGFATAYGALVSHDPAYNDSFGLGQRSSGFFNLSFDIQQNEGWYNESSVQEIMWQLQDLDHFWTVLNGPLRNGDAMVSPFALFAAYRAIEPLRAPTVDFLLQEEGIVGPTIDAYGSTETNNAHSIAVLPVYTPISIGGGSKAVRSTNQFGTGNKLSVHRYLRLNVPTAGNVRFRASAAIGRDPDMLVYRRGVSVGPAPGLANEDFSLVLQPGDYVIDVYDCGNAECNSSVTPGPVDITVTVTTS